MHVVQVATAVAAEKGSDTLSEFTGLTLVILMRASPEENPS